MRVLKEVVEPAIGTIESLIKSKLDRTDKSTDKIWANDFCRFCNVLKCTFPSIASLVELPLPSELGAPLNDSG